MGERLSETDLAKWDALLAKTSTGPWRRGLHHGPGADFTNIIYDSDEGWQVCAAYQHIGAERYESNVRFIVAAHEDLPALLSEIRALAAALATSRAEGERLRAERDALRAEIEKIGDPAWRRHVLEPEVVSAAESARDRLQADLDAARGALGGLLSVFWPTAEEGHTGFLDRLGMQFYRETGVWPHFKSSSMEVHTGDPEAARKAWTKWLDTKRDAAAAAAVAVLGPQDTHEGEEG